MDFCSIWWTIIITYSMCRFHLNQRGLLGNLQWSHKFWQGTQSCQEEIVAIQTFPSDVRQHERSINFTLMSAWERKYFETDAWTLKGMHIRSDVCTNRYDLNAKAMPICCFLDIILPVCVSPCHKLFITSAWLDKTKYIPSMWVTCLLSNVTKSWWPECIKSGVMLVLSFWA